MPVLNVLCLLAFFAGSVEARPVGNSPHTSHEKLFGAWNGARPFASGAFSGAAASQPARLRTHEVFGWHPYWREGSLPFYDFTLLSTVAYFSYEVNPSTGGYCSVHNWDTTNLVNAAQAAGCKVVLTATLFGNKQNETLLYNPAARQNLIQTLLAKVQARNADGVTIDFEALTNSGLREPLTTFMQELATTFHQAIPNSQVSIALPAVDWAGVFDVAAYDGFLDYAIIMGYNYHWSGGPSAGPVAPLGDSTTWGPRSTKTSINTYLAAGISPDKLLLGVPYYGIEWPTRSDSVPAATAGTGTAFFYSEAVSREQQHSVHWDESSQTPFYKRESNGQAYQGWYENAESLARKYQLIESKGLGGAGIWALGYDDGRDELWRELAVAFTVFAPLYPWEEQDSGFGETLFGGCFDGKRFWGVGLNGRISWSAEGSQWHTLPALNAQTLRAAAYGANTIVVVGDGGTVLHGDTRGFTETDMTALTSESLRDICFNGEQFVAVGFQGTILTSPDGKTWSAANSGVDVSLFGVAYGEGRFVAVGNSGVILASSDAALWTAANSPTASGLLDVAWSEGIFVAVGQQGVVLRSSGGDVFEVVTTPTTESLNSINPVYGGLAASGANGLLMRSVDRGMEWTISKTSLNETLFSIFYGKTLSLAIGNAGTVLRRIESTPYRFWANDKENAAGIPSLSLLDPLTDHDGDGLASALEYLLDDGTAQGFDPTTPDLKKSPSLTVSEGHAILPFHRDRAKDDFVLDTLASHNLRDWYRLGIPSLPPALQIVVEQQISFEPKTIQTWELNLPLPDVEAAFFKFRARDGLQH